MDGLISLDEIRAAAERLAPFVVRTPLRHLQASGLWLKGEHLQPVGSFKLRGAVNTLLVLGDAARGGVVAHSSGNHAIAVAHASALLGLPATVVMPSDAPAVKIERTRALGATVELVGPSSGERAARAEHLSAEHGLPLVEPYDSRAVLAATATIAVEILEDLPEVEPTIYVPVSGGGLAGGIAAGAKALDPGVRIVAVEPEVAADFVASRAAGRPVALPAEQMAQTAADGLRVQQVGELPWAHLAAFVDDAVTVSEAQIAEEVARLAAEARWVVEPSGAVASAGARLDAGRSRGTPPVAVVTGANVELASRSRTTTSAAE